MMTINFDSKKIFRLLLVTFCISGISSIFLGSAFYRAYHAHKQQLKEVSIKNYSVLSEKINVMHHTHIYFLISLILLVTAITSLITRSYTGNRKALWITVATYSFAILVAIAAIWHIEISYQQFKKHDNIIETQADIDDFFKQSREQFPSIYKAKHHIVPAGLLLYAIEVKQNNDAKIQTYAWANYDDEKDKDIMVPFRMANREVIITPNTFQQGNHTIYAWNSTVTIPQSFNFKKYPFDKQEILIDLYHPNFIQNVILTPDLSSYEQGVKFPQLRGDLILSRWEVDDAYFYYRLSRTTTNFGIKDNQQMNNFPYLRFVVEIHRDILNPLIATLLPILIIVFILFSVLLVIGKENAQTSLPAIVGLFSGLFFATLVSDQTFDKTINVPSITYFKSFYYIAYTLIFLVSVNCFLYLFRRIRIIQYEHNFVARILFWPVVSSIFFAVTIIFFYNVN